MSGLYEAKVGGYDESKPHTVPHDGVSKILKELAKRNLEERRALPGIGPRRAEIIIAGAMVFAELMDMCALRSFRYLPLGLRDGLLAQMLADYGAQPRHEGARRVRAPRRAAGRDEALRGRPGVCPADSRSHHAALSPACSPCTALPPQYADWLEAAAMLHEVGAYINRSGRRRHTHYIIANSELFGYTPVQRRIIAAIARYVGNSLPAAGDAVMQMVPRADQVAVPKAVALLRLARALDQGRRGAVRELHVRIQQDGPVRLGLTPASSEGVELELWAVEQERSYFKSVFGRDLFAELR